MEQATRKSSVSFMKTEMLGTVVESMPNFEY